MPLLRFDATRDRDGSMISTAPAHLVRFLASRPTLPGLVVRTLWPADAAHADDTVYAVTRGLRPREGFVTAGDGDSPYETLKRTAALFNGAITDAGELHGHEDAWRRGGLDRFLESIALQETAETPGTTDFVLMIRGDRVMIERTLELALAFGARRDGHGVALMMVNGAPEDAPACLLRVRNLASSYPLHAWRDDARLTLLYRRSEANACYVQWGYRYPFAELDALHPGLAPRPDRVPLTLITSDGRRPRWHHVDDARRFCPVARVADVHLSGPARPQRLGALPPEAIRDRRFQVELSLKRAPAPEDDPAVSTRYHGRSLPDRIRALEGQRAGVERELNRLKNLEQTHYMCLFEDTEAEAILQFVSQYPLSRLRRFLYLPCRDADGATMMHFLISREGTSRRDLPGDISGRGRIFIRDRAWHVQGVDIYLPEGYALHPFIGFDDAGQLLRILDPDFDPAEAEGMSVILRPERGRDGRALEKLLVPADRAIELTDALRYLNAQMRTTALRALAESTAGVQMAQFGHQYNEAAEQLSRCYEGLQQRFSKALADLNTDLDRALAELESRRQELDEHVAVTDAMAKYCHEVRLLIRNPGNVLFDFLRRETELHQTLAGRLATIDYRYNIQYEKYGHQVKDILHRDQAALQNNLKELLQRMKQDGAALQNQIEGIEKQFGRYRDVPERVVRCFHALKSLNTAIQEMAARNPDPTARKGKT